MPDTLVLRPGDPGRIGGRRIVGRLGAGGQGVVYLAEEGDGRRVAVKVLHTTGDPEADARFRREAEVLPGVASFCTAQVLEVGSADGVPYIVSEFVEGPTLQQAVRDRRPLGGRELRRVAVGTVTALAAIHRAGVVHRDFKPANVLLGRDGPRVIDFGIARAVTPDAAHGPEITEEGVLGTPAYMAPEILHGERPTPAADMFAWAGVIVFASSGRAPFGDDALPAVLRRLLTGDPDLGELDGDLREIAAECLAKDPAARPAASAVLLRLLGHPVAPAAAREGTDPSGLLSRGSAAASPGTITAPAHVAATAPRHAPAPHGSVPPHDPAPSPVSPPGPVGRIRPGVRRGIAVATAGVLLSAGVSAYVITRGPRTPGPGTSAAPAVAPVLSGPPPAAAARVAVPELKATLYEAPGDPVAVTSFLVKESRMSSPAYLRRPEGGVERLTEFLDPVVSPGGGMVAAVYVSPDNIPDHADDVFFTDRRTGERYAVPTVERPLLVGSPQWSRDGRRLLLTVSTGKDDDREAVGFVVVDPASRTARLTRIDDPRAGATEYGWAPDGASVVRGNGPLANPRNGISVYALDGTPVRTIPGLRWRDNMMAGFSPSGRLLAAQCPQKAKAVCVTDAATGKRRHRFGLPDKGGLWEWYNEDHLIVFDGTRSPWQARIVDLNGKAARLFGEFQGGDDTWWLLHITRKAA
ncbi:protein kinase [Microbispora sp. NPDC049125]|uniref:protein kinase domain-containing protein n=1 Tax=Microbispora sp. NPDC049125 TaxID=3154929 RepID=UPI003465B5DA